MKKLFSFLMLIGILAAGCSQEEYGYTTNMGDDANTPSFTFVEGTYLTPTIGSDGGALVYNFATNSAWSATSSEEWISITPASGDATATCFTISAPKNLTGHARTTTIKVEYGNGKSLEILLSQAAELCAVNEIAYRTTDGEIITPATVEGFGAEFTNNTYENGYGKLRFTGEVKSIPAEAFKGCTTLKLIILPEQLTTIGDSAFEGCTELQEIRFNKAVTTIGKMTFSECEALSTIVLGENITTIGEGAFNKCSQLESIAIPDGVSHIGDYTFYSCASLVAVSLGNSIESIGDSAFENCSALAEITLPDSVKSIADNAFANCHNLAKVTLGNNIESIGDYAFTYCKSLNSIALPNTVKSLGDYAFLRCEKLANITLSENLTHIGEATFANCSSLMSITLPAAITSIGNEAMFGCSRLSTINCMSTTPPTLGACAFDKYIVKSEGVEAENGDKYDRETYEVAAIGSTIYVPTNSAEAYKSAEAWSNYASKITGKSF